MGLIKYTPLYSRFDDDSDGEEHYEDVKEEEEEDDNAAEEETVNDDKSELEPDDEKAGVNILPNDFTSAIDGEIREQIKGKGR